jgi:hypothetical protein
MTYNSRAQYEPWLLCNRGRKLLKFGRGSPACALLLALLEALHVGVFRELRLGRADWQPGLLVALQEQVQLDVARIRTGFI